MKSQVFALLAIIGVTVNGQVLLDPCIINYDFKIVVLGSSTAAGAGTTNSDSAWVNRYRNALKAINPGNTVINLAVGGYTTYRIMPDAFIAPSNRPMVDTLRNITAALTLNPDAIIINLPSNDRQWPMQEQLNNFDSLFHHSWNSGVPLFICTTQPIQPISAASYQRAVRDSIINTYGQYAIEFFMPLADTNDAIQPQFAADAVHLNNTGHGVLFNQAWQADVLGKVFEPSPIPDLAAKFLILPEQQCADSLLHVGVVIANLGDTAQTGNLGWVKGLGPINDSALVMLNSLMFPCSVDTIWTSINLGLPGNYDLSFSITHLADTIFDNNTTTTSFETVEEPLLAVQADTLCQGQFTQFDANLVQGDTVFWYAALADTVPVLPTNGFLLQNDTSLFAQGVTGPLHYSEKLQTTNDWNINFNGNMFNLVAKRNLTLESFTIRSQQTGQILVNVYTKGGAYQGYEQSPLAWTLTFQDTLSVAVAEDSIILDIPDTTLNAGDTLAIYVHMANSGQRLLYRSGSSTVTYQTNALQFISGSGIGYNFGTDYPNRTINASFNYRFGKNLLGSCASPKTEVVRAVSRDSLFIGPDTTLPLTGITLQIGSFYQNPVWLDVITGDTLSTQSHVVIDSSHLQPGSNQVAVACIAIDRWGCVISDTITLTLLSDFSLEELSMYDVMTYPSPFTEQLGIMALEKIAMAQVFSISGMLIYNSPHQSRSLKINTERWSSGIYIVVLKTENGQYVQKVVKR